MVLAKDLGGFPNKSLYFLFLRREREIHAKIELGFGVAQTKIEF
jgi:hypothetical protein